jgi:hypothetical protein
VSPAAPNEHPPHEDAIRQGGGNPRSLLVMKVGRRLGAVWLLFVVAFHAAAQDVEPNTFWKRIQDTGIYERLWETTRLYENESR